MTDAVPAATTPPALQVDALRAQVRDLEAKLGRTTLKLSKLERDLDHARAQVAWFHRQLFGQKSEHVDTASLERAWTTYVDDQEAKARGWVPKSQAEPEPASGLQFLLNLGAAQVSPIVSAKDALAIAGITEESSKPDATTDAEGTPPDPKPKPKRSGGGRRAMPGTLRVEPLPLEPEGLGEDARRIDVKTGYRIAIWPAQVFAVAVERGVWEIKDESDPASDGSWTRVIADTPDEMIDRGLFAPSGLAHIIAQKWDQQVPYNRQSAYFAQHGVDLPKSTLSGVAIRAASKASLLVAAMTMLGPSRSFSSPPAKAAPSGRSARRRRHSPGMRSSRRRSWRTPRSSRFAQSSREPAPAPMPARCSRRSSLGVERGTDAAVLRGRRARWVGLGRQEQGHRHRDLRLLVDEAALRVRSLALSSGLALGG